MFLIFAFEGAVTSQVSAMKHTNSSKVFYIAAATLVSKPPVYLETSDRVNVGKGVVRAFSVWLIMEGAVAKPMRIVVVSHLPEMLDST